MIIGNLLRPQVSLQDISDSVPNTSTNTYGIIKLISLDKKRDYLDDY